MKKNASKKMNLFLSFGMLLISFILAVGALFAWFSISKNSNIYGVNISVVEYKHNGYILSDFNFNQEVPNDGFVIYPGDKLYLEATAIENNLDFGLKIAVNELLDAEFNKFFSTRNDLIIGRYDKIDSLNGLSGKELSYNYFDIDDYLSKNQIAGTTKSKVDFLKKFADSNNIHSTLKVKIIKRGGATLAEPIELSRLQPGNAGYEVYFSETSYPLSYNEKIIIEITYGAKIDEEKNLYYLPTATFDEDEVFGTGSYRSQNYNCFIGQSLIISFENKRP